MSKLLNMISLVINSLLLLYFSAAAVLLLSVRQPEAAAIGIIGGADGPTSIYVTTDLLPFASPGLIVFLLALCLLFELTFILNLVPKDKKI